MKGHTAELKEQAEVLEAALHENCQLRVQLEDAKINPDQLLNADQQFRAGHAYRIRIEYLNRSIWLGDAGWPNTRPK